MGTLAEPAGDASSSSTVAISSGVSSIAFYPDFILIVFKFYPDNIRIKSG